MDAEAELTLQIICYLQGNGKTPCSPARWTFVPGPGRGGDTYAEAAARLDAMDKPVVIGALVHPGYIAVWRPSAVDDNERVHIEHTLANQLGWLDDAFAKLTVEPTGSVRFEGVGRSVDVSVSVIRRWLGEYAVTWGWTIGRPTDASHHARLLVMRRFGEWSPGAVCGPRQ